MTNSKQDKKLESWIKGMYCTTNYWYIAESRQIVDLLAVVAIAQLLPHRRYVKPSSHFKIVLISVGIQEPLP